MPQNPISDDELRKTVGDSLNIFQSTIAIGSILLGFVFAALLQILSNPNELSVGQKVTVWLLVAAMLMLLIAVICFHITANQVVRYWGIFFPDSTTRSVGALLFPMGMIFMLLSSVFLLWTKGMIVLGIIVLIAAILLLLNLVLSFGKLHKNAPYVRNVGKSDGA